MFSGKTLKCLQRVVELFDLGMKCCYINHTLDTRSTKIFSTNSSKDIHIPKLIHQKKANVLNKIDVDSYDVVGIDESHFFQDLAVTVPEWLSQNKTVIVSGLSANYKMEPFGDILSLLSKADESEQLHAYCKCCLMGLENDNNKIINRKTKLMNIAPFTYRMGGDKGETLIGGHDKYTAVCRRHYNMLDRFDISKREEVFDML